MNKNQTIWNKDFILLLSVNAFVFIGMHMLSADVCSTESEEAAPHGKPKARKED